MRNKMPVYVIREGSKVIYQNSYLRDKNFLIYIPKLTEHGELKKKNTPTRKSPTSFPVVK